MLGSNDIRRELREFIKDNETSFNVLKSSKSYTRSKSKPARNTCPHLQLLLLVSSNDFEFIIHHGGLGQVQGLRGHQGEGPGGPAHLPVHVDGAVVGRGHGTEPRSGAAHSVGGHGHPQRVPENLPVGRLRVPVSEAHVGSGSQLKTEALKGLYPSL